MPRLGYILCTAPRSGSTLLCRMLTATGTMGDPHSYFRAEDIADWADDWGISSDAMPGSDTPSPDYLNAAIAAGRGETPVFGLRLMQESLAGLLIYLRALSYDQDEDRTCLEGAFGPLLFIHLEREDTIAQAISLLRAEQSGLWHKASDGSDLERLEPTTPAGYDFDRLHQHVEDLNAQKSGWRTWFDAQRINPLRVSYEQLSDDPTGVLIRICDAMGVAPPQHDTVEVPTAKLRDETTTLWKARYEEDRRKL